MCCTIPGDGAYLCPAVADVAAAAPQRDNVFLAMLWTHKAFWMTPLTIAIILLLFSAALSHGLLHRVYQRQLAESRRERLFLASIGYFTAALVVRGITFAIHNHIGPFHDVSMHGRHIHHLVWGIALLVVVGYFLDPPYAVEEFRMIHGPCQVCGASCPGAAIP